MTHVAPELCREQGFVAGLALRPNGYTAARQSEREQRELLLQLTDMLRVAMAGNLRSVQLQDRTGKTVRGAPMLEAPPGSEHNCWIKRTVLCAPMRSVSNMAIRSA